MDLLTLFICSLVSLAQGFGQYGPGFQHTKDGISAVYRNDLRQLALNNLAAHLGTGIGTAPSDGVPGSASDLHPEVKQPQVKYYITHHHTEQSYQPAAKTEYGQSEDSNYYQAYPTSASYYPQYQPLHTHQFNSYYPNQHDQHLRQSYYY